LLAARKLSLDASTALPSGNMDLIFEAGNFSHMYTNQNPHLNILYLPCILHHYLLNSYKIYLLCNIHTHTHTTILFYIILSLTYFTSDSAFIRKVQLKGLHMVSTRCGKTPCRNSIRWQGGTKTKIYCQGTICQRCVLFTACQIGSDKVVNQAKPLKFSDKSCFSYQFKADVQHLATDLDTHPTMTCAFENTKLQPDGYCCLNDTGNKILFRINSQHVNQGFNVAP
jgi:hypothetical protein